jgi:hypothetical protein
MKFATVFLDILGYTMAAVVMFLLSRIAVPYLLSQPSTLAVVTAYMMMIVVFASAIALLVTLIYPLFKMKDSKS